MQRLKRDLAVGTLQDQVNTKVPKGKHSVCDIALAELSNPASQRQCLDVKSETRSRSLTTFETTSTQNFESVAQRVAQHVAQHVARHVDEDP